MSFEVNISLHYLTNSQNGNYICIIKVLISSRIVGIICRYMFSNIVHLGNYMDFLFNSYSMKFLSRFDIKILLKLLLIKHFEKPIIISNVTGIIISVLV